MTSVLPTKKGVQGAPSSIGVYLFVAPDGTYSYIGKSVNLKARLLSHLQNATLDAKERAIIESTCEIRLIPVESEFKALVLEAKLIRKYKPKYNKIWRDDKSYLYAKIDTKETYPKIRLVRRQGLGSLSERTHFGPFSSRRVLEKILREIRRVIPYCSFDKLGKKPCFHSKIGLCNPCPNMIHQLPDGQEKKRVISQYRKNVRNIARILSGSVDIVLDDLYKKLKTLSKEERYEEALSLRNRIFQFEQFVKNRTGIEREEADTLGSEGSIDTFLPFLKHCFPHLSSLARVECYDISNTSQKQATASMVVMTNGFVDKSQYRKFCIKNPRLRSDFEALEEVMRRRFDSHSRHSPLLASGYWVNPDLIVVDGGKPQVRTIMKTLSELGIMMPVIGIAKNPDRLILPSTRCLPAGRQARLLATRFHTVRPPQNHPGFNAIRLLRDEAHRFSHKYHLLLRNKKLLGKRTL